MTFNMKKVFSKNCTNANKLEIVFVDYDTKNEYYSFLSEWHRKGLRQVIITTHIMLKIIKKLVLEYNFKICNIVFMEEDDELKYTMREILNINNANPQYYFELGRKLNFLEEKSSIEIKKVYLNNKDVDLLIQANGILGITPDNKFYTDIVKQDIEGNL